MGKELWDDIRRIANITAELGSGKTHLPGGAPAKPGKGASINLRGSVVGPEGNEIFYEFSCGKRQRNGAFGPGTCSVIEIARSGPGAAGLQARTTVGNLFGLSTQLARDASKAWGIKPSPERGFEGARRKRARHARRTRRGKH